MLICNGSPKTGTHLLLKTLVLFGEDCKLAIHSHTPYSQKKDGVKYINIFRSPRNVIGSWLRFTRQDVTEQNLIKNIPSLVQEMFGYVEWWTDKSDKDFVLNVKYEELLTNYKIIDDIATFINKAKKVDHFKKIWGGTPTFTNTPFIWRDHWTDVLEATWVNNGGLILENAIEYDPYKVWIRRKTS